LESDVKPYLDRLSKMKSDRYNYESAWQEVSDLMLPKRDFTTTRSPGQRRTQTIYDSTALHAVEQLAGGLHGMLTPPSGKWAFLRFRGGKETREERLWLDESVNFLFDIFSSPEGSFATSAFEFYLDIVAFGNAAMAVTFKDGRLMYTTEQLRCCYTMENENGKNDIIYLEREYRPIEMIRRFGEANVHKDVMKAYKAGQTVTFKVIQAIEPRDEHFGRGAIKNKKPYKSCFIDATNKHLMLEEGFDDFPFMFARWSKRAGEAYGYGPGVAAYSEASQLNTIVETMMRSAAKNTDPPLLSPAEGMILPLRLDPGSINFYNPDLGEPKFWQNGSNPNYFDAIIEQKRALLLKMFYVDWMNLPQVDRMTTVEVNQRTQDSLRQLSPMLSRLSSEFLSPVIYRTLFLAIDNKLIPKPPESSFGKDLAIEYTSPIAIAQRSIQANTVLQGLSIGAQLAQFDSNIPLMVDADAVFKDQLLNTYSWPQKYLRSEEEVQEMKAAKEQQAQQMQQAQAAESYGKTAKNVAGAMSESGMV
jgi:hypothetical protein